LVVAGDNWLEQGFTDCRRAFEKNPACPLVVVRQIPEPVPAGRYSEVLLNTDGTVTRFREKPMVVESSWSAIAVYFFPQELAQWVADYLEQGGNPDAPGHFLAWVCEHHQLRSTPLQGDWHDVGSLEGLASLRDELDARG
jgi:glucose-1-phosphate thymidylyltransferase